MSDRLNAAWMRNAVNKIIRLESPTKNFSRVLMRDFAIELVVRTAGSRIKRCELGLTEPHVSNALRGFRQLKVADS